VRIPDGNTSYTSLLRQIPSLPQDLNKWHPLFEILGCVSIDTHNEGLGMLSVIVWNKENRRGSGFYLVATEDCDWRSSASEEEIFSAEFRRVHEASPFSPLKLHQLMNDNRVIMREIGRIFTMREVN